MCEAGERESGKREERWKVQTKRGGGHDPANAGAHAADPRIRKIVADAIGITEEDYTSGE